MHRKGKAQSIDVLDFSVSPRKWKSTVNDLMKIFVFRPNKKKNLVSLSNDDFMELAGDPV